MTATRALPHDTDLLNLHRANPRAFPCLLQSFADGTPRARFDLLLFASGAGLRLDPDGITRRLDGSVVEGGFLDALDADWSELRKPPSDRNAPFVGGWALFLGYELAAQVEPRLRLPQAPDAPPTALALRCTGAIVRDHASGQVCALSEDAAALTRLLQASAARESPPATVQIARIEESAADDYLQGVSRVLDYLAAGDVFQVNLSRAWTAELRAPIVAADLYVALRRANPAPFAGLLSWDGLDVVSSSPERLVSVRGKKVETRPIAGTRPRLRGDDEPSRIRELIGHPKERAEHIMLIDLERNDLGRVCRPGSIEVDELMSIESYAHVHHIVSNVRGVLRDGTTPGQVIRAVFPGGTITGCPKVRCMEIIAELEHEGRGPYTGALGYLDRSGDLDLNILIRTLWRHRGPLRLRAGAGIVADSEPQAELAETRAKARGLLRALDAE